MPKLYKDQAQKASEAEGFGLFEEGMYVGTLMAVEERTGKDSGKAYWSWRFGSIFLADDTDDPPTTFPGSLFTNTSLSEEALWKLNEAFSAFGVETDTDTDELIGEQCLLVVTQSEIEQGSRKGQMGNNVEQLLPLEYEEEDDGGTEEEPEPEPEPEPAPKPKATRRPRAKS